MDGHVLRKFLYLDSALLDDFLAGLEDVMVDETITETSGKGRGIEAGAGVYGMKASGKAERSDGVEVRRELRVTDAMKFQRLYSTLQSTDGFTYWEMMEEANWADVARNQLIEAEVVLVQSTIGGMASKLDGLMGIMQVVAPDQIDEETAEAIQGLGMLGQMEAEKGIPLRMELIGSKKYKFVAHLKPDRLRIPRDELTGEATLFAKVQRKFAPNETMDLFDMTGGVENLALNRDQRRALKNKQIPAQYRNPVRAPAATVIPIAIYQ